MAHTRPFIATSIALAGAAAIAAGPGIVATGAPTPLALSNAKYELTSLADITIEGITGALVDGWGGFIGPDDAFYPNTFNNDVKLTGANGVAYYLVDQALDAPYNVDKYFFEVGSQSTGNILLAGLGAAAYVGVGSAFGVDSVPAQLVKAITTGSFDLSNLNIGNILGNIDLANIGPAVLALTAGIPVLGPVASVYFTGQAPGDATVYGTGLAGVVAYAQTALPGISNLINGFGGGESDDDESEDESDHSDKAGHDESDDADEVESHDAEDAEDVEDDADDAPQPKSAAAVTVVADTTADTVAPVTAPTTAPAAVVKAPARTGIVARAAAAVAEVSAPAAEPEVGSADVAEPRPEPKRGLHRDTAAAQADAPAHTGKRSTGRAARNN